MTLHQRISHLLGQWRGLDATQRSNQQDEFVSELIATIKQESHTVTVTTIGKRSADAQSLVEASAA